MARVVVREKKAMEAAPCHVSTGDRDLHWCARGASSFEACASSSRGSPPGRVVVLGSPVHASALLAVLHSLRAVEGEADGGLPPDDAPPTSTAAP